jgi:hypothetical protein
MQVRDSGEASFFSSGSSRCGYIDRAGMQASAQPDRRVKVRGVEEGRPRESGYVMAVGRRTLALSHSSRQRLQLGGRQGCGGKRCDKLVSGGTGLA